MLLTLQFKKAPIPDFELRGAIEVSRQNEGKKLELTLKRTKDKFSINFPEQALKYFSDPNLTPNKNGLKFAAGSCSETGS